AGWNATPTWRARSASIGAPPSPRPGQPARAGRPGRGRSGEAGQRGTAVVGDHVAEGGDDVDRAAARWPVPVGAGAVPGADDPLGLRPGREAAQVGGP